ncbi:MAG: c-type cytochrome [Candidatus Andeanibacterium colombiense]|uniref:C-type cytochrome n=1 Tax=Candidatus Andeanibacterium colombiense TaxID=3121345 RepID=A0AAJ5X4A5_9SPHN|nr:MAG: c-type cytochrome [Sphingomonadaceae bacterium]
MNALKLAAALGLGALLAGCGGSGSEATVEATESAAAPSETATVAAAATAPASFAICSACHSVNKGENGIGPSLHAIYGTKAGEVAGFEFSPELLKAGLTWDDATLDKWLANPQALVPGTKMSFGGLPDAAQRKEVIEYLKTLK